jgi:predicted DNA-binding transcriptional regulator AlpA
MAAAGLAPKLISPKHTWGLTSLSPREQKRRAALGRFPKPVPIGKGRNGRIAYVEAEVLAWNAARIAERDRHVAPAGEPEPEQPSTAAPAIAERATAQQRRESTAKPKRSSGGGRRS